MVERLSVIIRSQTGREHFLDECLFILSNQTYREIEALIVVQTRPGCRESTEQIVTCWRPLFADLKVICHESISDARSRALNIGMKNASGPYIAFLDDDDKVYPDHYRRLIKAIQKSGRSWAYADTVQTLIDQQGRVRKRWQPYIRRRFSYTDLLAGNFIPIHSYVFDRRQAPGLFFDERLCRLEDYDFLLRLAKASSPMYVRRTGCAYCLRDDATNSVSCRSDEARLLWKQMDEIVRQKIAREVPLILRASARARRFTLRPGRQILRAARSWLGRFRSARLLYGLIHRIWNAGTRRRAREVL